MFVIIVRIQGRFLSVCLIKGNIYIYIYGTVFLLWPLINGNKIFWWLYLACIVCMTIPQRKRSLHGWAEKWKPTSIIMDDASTHTMQVASYALSSRAVGGGQRSGQASKGSKNNASIHCSICSTYVCCHLNLFQNPKGLCWISRSS